MEKLKYIISIAIMMLSLYPFFWFITGELNPLNWSVLAKVIVIVLEVYIVKTGLSVYRDEKV
jgi:hypothetical protein